MKKKTSTAHRFRSLYVRIIPNACRRSRLCGATVLETDRTIPSRLPRTQPRPKYFQSTCSRRTTSPTAVTLLLLLLLRGAGRTRHSSEYCKTIQSATRYPRRPSLPPTQLLAQYRARLQVQGMRRGYLRRLIPRLETRCEPGEAI